MKRFLTVIGVMFSLLMTSCQFSEDVYINEDGTGSMTYSIDASEIMEMAAGMGNENEKQSLEKAMDSTIVFKELLENKKDSISKLPKADQEKLKSLENFKMHILTDPETKTMVFDLTSNFKNVSEMQNMFRTLNDLSSLNTEINKNSNDSAGPFDSMGARGSTEVSYAFDGKTFKRSAIILDKEKHQREMDSLGDSEMMFGSSRYKVNYHFPRAVKSVSKEDAKFSEDRKTVTFDVSFLSVIKEPDILDFEVVLEDK